MPPVGFETKISAGNRPQTYALDGAATETGLHTPYTLQLYLEVNIGLKTEVNNYAVQ